MIRVTREQLIASEKGLSILSTAKLPVGLAYRINRIIKQVANELQETESIRQEIIQKYAKHDEDGNVIVDKVTNYVEFDNDSRIEFGKEITILFNEICEINGEPIDACMLDSVFMTPQDIESITPFLRFE